MLKLPKTMEMVKTLIGIPSVSSVDSAIDMSNVDVVETLAGWADGLGFDVELVEVGGSRSRKLNLVATLGSGPGGLLLSGHTDTVPFDGSGWDTDPFSATERGDALYGLGTADMKTFLALALVAAAGIDRTRLKEPIRLIATSDEECTMAGVRALVDRNLPLGRAAIIGEPTSLRPIRMHKGKESFRITLEGRSGHSSNPAFGLNALDGMHEAIGAVLSFREELAREQTRPDFDVPQPTINLGRIAGGDAPNRICAHCELDIDLRALPGTDVEALSSALRKRVDEAVEGRGLRLEFERAVEHGVPPFETDPTAEIVRAVESVTGNVAGSAAFATEAPFLQRLGMETVVVGPGSIDVAHQPNEHVPLASIQPTVEMLTRLIAQFCMA